MTPRPPERVAGASAFMQNECVSTAKPGLVRIPSVQDWAGAPPENEPEEFGAIPQDLGPNEPAPRPPVEAITVVVGVKRSPMKLGKGGQKAGAGKGPGGGRGGRGGRSAKAWAKSKGKTDRR